MIIINADDFGLSKDINSAIYEAFQKNLISSTSLIVNINESFNDALNYIISNKISNNNVGLHLNFEEGPPLTNNIRNIHFICNSDGNFYFNFRVINRFFYDNYIISCIKEEIEAQINKYIQYVGNYPSHIDSHNHTHTEFAMINCLLPILKDYKIYKIRLTRNIGDDINLLKFIYKKIFNNKLKANNFITTDFFGDLTDYKNFNFKKKSNVEIMVHPLYNQQKDLIDLCGNSLINKMNVLFGSNVPNLNSYNDLKL
jgi:predicted glycoside hydrolase/deacetylase ChbG (UPF0249 family)